MQTKINQSRSIKSLIQNECANYFVDSGGINKTIKNYCCLIDKTCIYYFNEDDEQSPRCRYFEESVLPMNPELEYQYRQEKIIDKKQELNGNNNLQHKCINCQNTFTRKNKNEKYCEECKATLKKHHNKVNMRKYRKKVSVW